MFTFLQSSNFQTQIMLFGNPYKWAKRTCFLDFDTHRVLVEHTCLMILSEIPQVDINETDEYGFTGLHMASENGHLKVKK